MNDAKHLRDVRPIAFVLHKSKSVVGLPSLEMELRGPEIDAEENCPELEGLHTSPGLEALSRASILETE